MELLTRNNFEGWMQKLMERLDRQLTARIGAGNDERIILLTQRNVHRDTFFRVNERVPRPDKGE